MLSAAKATGFPETLRGLRDFIGIPAPAPLNEPLVLGGDTTSAVKAFARLRGSGAEGVTAMKPVGGVQITHAPKRDSAQDPFESRITGGPLQELADALGAWPIGDAIRAIHAALLDDARLLPEAVALTRGVVAQAGPDARRTLGELALPYVERGARLTPDRRGMQVRYDILAWLLETARLAQDPPDPSFDPLAVVVLRQHASFANAYLDALSSERASAVCRDLIRNRFRTPLDPFPHPHAEAQRAPLFRRLTPADRHVLLEEVTDKETLAALRESS